jgi:hypothetical protein
MFQVKLSAMPKPRHSLSATRTAFDRSIRPRSDLSGPASAASAAASREVE